MNKFYSSLVINGKKFSNVHQVFKPRYNKEFFKRLLANVEQLEKQIEKRCKCSTLSPMQRHLDTFKQDSQKLVKLKEQLEKIEKKNPNDESKLTAIRDQLVAIEDRIMPLTVVIPNRVSKQTPPHDTVVDEVKSNFSASENLTKVLSHTKLSYINNCYSKSVVGPNSHYYYGIGAKLQYGLSDYFSSKLEERDYMNVSGLSLTKSAVVEASNIRDLKDYTTDPCRILTNELAYTSLHLVEASRESMLAFVSTLGPMSSNTPLRLMTSGAGYRCGSDWFDSDARKVTQFETLHAMTLNSSIEQYSMKEYQETTNHIWSLYKSLNLPTRLVHCSLDSMLSNEYDSHRIDIWLPSAQDWLQVSRVSHYLDYITVRAGMKRGHIIDATAYDGQALFAAIVENNQTSTGKFIIPSVIKDHMTYLSDQEKNDYFRDSGTLVNKLHVYDDLKKGAVLSNYEQRRYLVKKSYLFGHSKRAHANKLGGKNRTTQMFLLGCVVALAMFDWEEIYIIFVPKSLKRFTYDRIYRPLRRVWRNITSGSHLADLPFDQIDWSDHDKTMYERKRKIFEKKKYIDGDNAVEEGITPDR